MTIDRRRLVKCAVAALGSGGALASAKAFAGDSSGKQDFAAIARRLLAENAGRIKAADRIAVADFAAPSWRPRFHLVDMISGEVASYLVAHGRGSDPSHTGWLQSFSNAVGSNASSYGAYLTGARYSGKYGPSMRLAGLDAENSNAQARAIVIHAAWYVGAEMLGKYGKLGRSEGCFAFSETDRSEVVERLGEGRLLFAGKF